MMQLKIMALIIWLPFTTWVNFAYNTNVVEEFPVVKRASIGISLNARHNFSRLQSIRDTDIYTMDQDWILLILRSNPAPRSSQNSLRSAIQRRFCPAIVCPRSPRFLSWSRQSPLVLLWSLCLDSGPQSVSHLIWVLLPGIAAESQVTLMAHGEHLSVYYSDLSISSNLSQVSPSVQRSQKVTTKGQFIFMFAIFFTILLTDLLIN